MAIAYIALGSNLGDRQRYLQSALAHLRQAGVAVERVSSMYETAPLGGPPGQGPYLNAAARVQTELAPRTLLDILLETERRLGRVRDVHHGPRTIDLDLLLYDDQVVRAPGLELPHPRLHERWFVLAPLAEIAADVRHPLLHRTIGELLSAMSTPQQSRAQPLSQESWKVQEAMGLEPEVGVLPPPGRELTGLRAAVTGATSGIGRAIALELAAAGADVLIHGRRQPAAEAVVAEAAACQVQAHFVLADLDDEDACRNFAERCWKEFGPLQIWVNNAGADTLTGEAGHWSFARKLEELWKIDVRATMLLARDIGQRMKADGQGVILNMGWDQADTGMEGDSGQLFGATKAAVMAFSKSLALTLAPQVRVNCLAPGWIRTAWGEQASATWQERVRRETPLGRWGTPEDVARTARWLVSPHAAYITGQIVRINGGAVR